MEIIKQIATFAGALLVLDILLYLVLATRRREIFGDLQAKMNELGSRELMKEMEETKRKGGKLEKWERIIRIPLKLIFWNCF